MFFHVQAKTREEIIEFLADKLLEQGYVRPDYKTQALKREQMSSTAIGGRIAIPHAPYQLVEQSGLAAATLESPIFWEQEKVSLVLMIACSLQDKAKMKAFFKELADLTEDHSRLDTLLQQENADDFIRILKKKEV
jgi:mannitol/fructose-specific phosphotransferase system IIA component (Ntr-type)